MQHKLKCQCTGGEYGAFKMGERNQKMRRTILLVEMRMQARLGE